MGLIVHLERRGDLPIVSLAGDLDVYTVEGFRRGVEEIAESSGVAVDLTEVGFVDSSGLGALLALLTTGDGPRPVAVVCRGPAIPRLLELGHLLDRFVVASSVDEAVDALSTPAP